MHSWDEHIVKVPQCRRCVHELLMRLGSIGWGGSVGGWGVGEES